MKRIILPILLILIVCGAAAYLLTLRPFAPTLTPLAYAPTVTGPGVKIDSVQTATPELQAAATKAAPTPTPAELGDSTPEAQPAATILPQDADLTRTAIPAQKTFDAIDARSRFTPSPTRGPSPTPRAIDMTTNLLLMGTDLRPNDPTWVPATDVIMVYFLDTTNRRSALLSIPRDLVVAIPHHGAFRINYVYQYGLRSHGPGGGAALVKQVLHDEFNIRIDHWALIDFTGLEKIIDTLNGIDLHVPCALEDTIDQQHFVIPAGDVHMDYLTAKWYVQSRYSTSDTSRNFRQQRVLWAIAKKAFQLNALDRVPTVWDQLKDSIQTDMSLLDMVSLIPAAYNLDLQNHPERIRSTVLESPAVYPFVADYGAWLYMPNYSRIEELLDNPFESPEVAPAGPGPGECIGAASAPNSETAASPTPPP